MTRKKNVKVLKKEQAKKRTPKGRMAGFLGPDAQTATFLERWPFQQVKAHRAFFFFFVKGLLRNISQLELFFFLNRHTEHKDTFNKT